MNAIVNQAAVVETNDRRTWTSEVFEPLVVGDTTTCQFGNSFDTDWTEATHANQDVKILAITECEFTKKTYYLVKRVDGSNLVGRAAVPYRRTDEADYCQGMLYCTNARSFGPGSHGERFGFMTLEQAAGSLGFEINL
jgi:hypothetical protein